LVLAGQRPSGDAMAEAAGIRLKALLPVAGRPMLARVVEALRTAPAIGRIAVSIPEPAAVADLGVLAIATEPSPSLSVLAALERLETPILVTTADHPLLNAAIVGHFLDAAGTAAADLLVGLVERGPIEAVAAGGRRTYWHFKDGDFSGANLFYLQNPAAAAAVTFWRRVEEERKRPWRIVQAMGPGLLVGYLARRLTLAAAMQRASARLGCRVAAVVLPMGEAAIDVDKPADLALVEQLLRRRAEPAP